MRIGITGHSNLTPPSEKLVYDAMRGVLKPYLQEEVSGVTCLARGADQIFARVIGDVGSQFAVVLPSRNYRDKKVKPANRDLFDELLSAAVEVTYLPFDEPGRDAYMAASEELVSRSDLLIAVWDGKPAGGYGGTADVVAYALSQGRRVLVLWPEGAERD
ncbi:hypothetical protein [Kribbella sp. NPDC051718]|uniref:hypothetical protein n=1 Tax=Kribbella sp. NPDC051718 TaxID=3155168 RepID=UPI00343083D3